MRSYLAGALLCLGACAVASREGGADAKRDSSGGGDTFVPLDGPSGPDAAQMITVSETADTTVATGGTSACQDTNPLSSTYGNTGNNVWYRAFQLSDYPMITGGMHITAVTFGVETASAAPPLTIKIGTYSGTLDGTTINSAQVSSLAMATNTPANAASPTSVMVPIVADIPAGGKFVVTISAPSDINNGYFFLGSTAGTETHKGYWSSTDCGQTTPAVTSGSDHIIIDIVGTH